MWKFPVNIFIKLHFNVSKMINPAMLILTIL